MCFFRALSFEKMRQPLSLSLEVPHLLPRIFCSSVGVPLRLPFPEHKGFEHEA
jgi:hypothetical protein